VDDCLVCRVKFIPHSRPKHIEKINKHSKKICVTSWFYLQDLKRPEITHIKRKAVTVRNSKNNWIVPDQQGKEKGINRNTDLGPNFVFFSEVLTFYRAVKVCISDSTGLLQPKSSVQN
jgi:hypothetical protein